MLMGIQRIPQNNRLKKQLPLFSNEVSQSSRREEEPNRNLQNTLLNEDNNTNANKNKNKNVLSNEFHNLMKVQKLILKKISIPIKIITIEFYYQTAKLADSIRQWNVCQS